MTGHTVHVTKWSVNKHAYKLTSLSSVSCMYAPLYVQWEQGWSESMTGSSPVRGGVITQGNMLQFGLLVEGSSAICFPVITWHLDNLCQSWTSRASDFRDQAGAIPQQMRFCFSFFVWLVWFGGLLYQSCQEKKLTFKIKNHYKPQMRLFSKNRQKPI